MRTVMPSPPSAGDSPAEIARATVGSIGGTTEPTASPPSAERRMAFLLALLALALYVPTLAYDFVWDDFLMAVDNQYFKHPQYIPLYFTGDFAQLTSGGLSAVYYRPLFALSFLLDYTLWGNNPAGYHLTNVLLYALTVYLAYRVSRRLFADARVALGGTLLFAVHPAHVETVAFVSGRPDVMAALGILGAILGYRRFREGTGACRWMALVGSLVGLAAGVLSKEMAVSLPALLVWWECTLGRRRTEVGAQAARTWPFAVLPHIAMVAGVLWYRWGAVQNLAPSGFGVGIVWDRLPGTLEVLSRYTTLAVWPFRMQAAYTQARPESVFAPWSAIGALVAVLAACLVLVWWRRWPEAAFALGWFLASLAPVLDLFPVGPRAVNMADRYLFIPSLGICWLLALAGIRVWDRWTGRPRRLAIASAGAAIGLLLAWTGATMGYAAAWRDNIALFSRMVRDLPTSSLGYLNLGLALVRAGRLEEAVPTLEQAVRLTPHDLRSQLSLARTYVESGRVAEGFRILDRVGPRAERDKMYHMVRARAHMVVGDWEGALLAVSRGLQAFPDLAEGYQVLGFVQERRGRMEEARDAYRHAVALRPDLAWSYRGLAQVQLQLGQPREAQSAAEAATALDPDSLAAWRLLAEASERSGDARRSREAQERVRALERSAARGGDVAPDERYAR